MTLTVTHIEKNQGKYRGLGLCSGGLDSILAALVLKKQGLNVEWICYKTPFFSSHKAEKAASMTGIPLTIKNITKEYLLMLKNPACGYGKNMNPCLDCHSLMFRLAGKAMKEGGFSFMFSGEVLGQRPMSQTRSSLRYVEKNSNHDGYILRPLSAKKLPITIPEQNGIVDREQLLGISGRSRKIQIKMAEDFGINDYPTPSGGCLLTDKGFSRRLKDLFKHQQVYKERDFELLKFGRHMRLTNNSKIIVGRTKKDNDNIVNLYDPEKDILIDVPNYPSPQILMPNKGEIDDIKLASSICIGYTKAKNGINLKVNIKTPAGSHDMEAYGIDINEIKDFII